MLWMGGLLYGPQMMVLHALQSCYRLFHLLLPCVFGCAETWDWHCLHSPSSSLASHLPLGWCEQCSSKHGCVSISSSWFPIHRCICMYPAVGLWITVYGCSDFRFWRKHYSVFSDGSANIHCSSTMSPQHCLFLASLPGQGSRHPHRCEVRSDTVDSSWTSPHLLVAMDIIWVCLLVSFPDEIICFLLICGDSLYSLDVKPLSGIWFGTILSYFVGCLFTLDFFSLPRCHCLEKVLWNLWVDKCLVYVLNLFPREVQMFLAMRVSFLRLFVTYLLQML